jgi:hypothetical protein
MEERSPPGQAGPPLVEFRLHDGAGRRRDADSSTALTSQRRPEAGGSLMRT